MTGSDPQDELARNLACGLWAALVAVVVLGAIVAVALFGVPLGTYQPGTAHTQSVGDLRQWTHAPLSRRRHRPAHPEAG